MSGNSPQGGGPVKAYGSSGVAAVRLGNSIAPVLLDKWGQKEHIAIWRHGKDDADQGF